MTPAELKAAAIRLYGERGHTVALAQALKVDYSQVWRWLSGRTPIPGPVEAAVLCWLEKTK
jgi:transposase-like protein